MTALMALLLCQANIHDVIHKYEKSLKKIDGVLDVSVGGINGEQRIVIRVDGDEARRAVQQLIGEKLDGFPIYLLATAARKPAAPVAAKETTPAEEEPLKKPATAPSKVGQTVAAPRPLEPERTELEKIFDDNYAAEECDILRELLKLPARKEGKTGRCCWTRRIVYASPGAVAAPITVRSGGGQTGAQSHSGPASSSPSTDASRTGG
jgi:hypothetical protein